MALNENLLEIAKTLGRNTGVLLGVADQLVESGDLSPEELKKIEMATKRFHNKIYLVLFRANQSLGRRS